jgi:two-component system, LytTR family, sensor histidine kinase AlgZ
MPGPSPESGRQAPPGTPDFRNLGTLLRVILLAETVNFLFHLALTGYPLAAMRAMLGQAHLFETTLLATLLILMLASPRLARLRFRQHALVGVGLACAITLALHWGFSTTAPELFQASLFQAGLLAAVLAAAIYFYLHWRMLTLSPALSEARLMALQARIRPHFLYNSLNTVLGLIRQDPRRAESVLENLADLFRALLAEARNLVPLERELELARAYADVEGLRLGERMKLVWHVEGAPLSAQVPQLILQPLIENAVIHGIEPSPAGGEIHVSTLRKGDQLLILVRNPMASANPDRKGNGMALDNIRERLNLHFDAEARLTHYTAGNEFIVQIEIPLKT